MKLSETRADQILNAFKKFHAENPEVWKLFCKFSIQAKDAGLTHYSANAIFERIRWHIAIDTKKGDVKLNNNFRAYYARMFHLAYPGMDGFFRNRKLISDERGAADNDKQVFIDQQAGDEQVILSSLRNILNENK